jgi:hypothetical protein
LVDSLDESLARTMRAPPHPLPGAPYGMTLDVKTIFLYNNDKIYLFILYILH